jgi:hypothetical protein
MLDILSDFRVDFSDFIAAGKATRNLARALAEDRTTLRELVHGVLKDDRFAMCERHQLLDYLVLYDAPERGFRVRLHLSTEDHFDRPHDHRFSFSSYILTGTYRHTWYECDRDPYAESSDEECQRWDSLRNPDENSSHLLNRVSPLLMRDETPGSCYTLHHSVLHTTFTTPGTVSVFVRGPSEKRRSVIMDKTTGRVWWRYGQQEESRERRSTKAMTRLDYEEFVGKLESLGVI